MFYSSSFTSLKMLWPRTMDKVDATMAAVNEQRELANEIAEAISNPVYGGADMDEVSLNCTRTVHPADFCLNQDALKEELAELEQDELNERLMGADHVPIHNPAGTSRVEGKSSSCCG